MFLTNFVVVLCILPLVLSETNSESECGLTERRSPSGVITSPGYPSRYHDSINCKWLIIYPPNANLTIRVTDLDVEEDDDCVTSPCCTYNWLSLESKLMCGRNASNLTFVLSNDQTKIKFHTSKGYHTGRGFRLVYHVCREDQFQCADKNSCVDRHLVCDGIDHCGDGSDEWRCEKFLKPSCFGEDMVPCGGSDSVCYNNVTARCNGSAECPNTGNDEKNCGACGPHMLYCKGGGCYPTWGWCDNNVHCANGWDEGIRGDCSSCSGEYVSCGHPDNCHCYLPKTQRCDGQMDCPHGQDEISCDASCVDSIACALIYPDSIPGQFCYTSAQRCDGIPNCADNSDEDGCFKTFIENKFRCADSGRCIDDLYVCNGRNDCNDGSDESDCVKNSTVTAVAIGSLICGMIVVLGAAIGWRYYYSRCSMPAVISISGSGGFRHQSDEGPLDEASLYHLYREPPPSYHEAMRQDGNVLNYCHPTRFMNIITRRSDSSVPAALPRRERSIRPRPPQPLPKPPQLIKPADEPCQTTSQIITGDELYPESGVSTDRDTPMLELSGNSVSTSSVDRPQEDSDSRSPSGTSMSSLLSCECQMSYQHQS